MLRTGTSGRERKRERSRSLWQCSCRACSKIISTQQFTMIAKQSGQNEFTIGVPLVTSSLSKKDRGSCSRETREEKREKALEIGIHKCSNFSTHIYRYLLI